MDDLVEFIGLKPEGKAEVAHQIPEQHVKSTYLQLVRPIFWTMFKMEFKAYSPHRESFSQNERVENL